MIDRVHNPPYPPPNGLPNTTQQQEYLLSQPAQPFDYVRRIIELETRVSQLEAALAKGESDEGTPRPRNCCC